MYTILKDDLEKIDDNFIKDATNGYKKTEKEIIAAAWGVYVNAYSRTEDFLLVGRHSKHHFNWGASEASLKSIFNIDVTPIPVGIETKNKDGKIVIQYKKMNETVVPDEEDKERKVKRGGILYASKWSLLVNDAWLLGGIHSNKKFIIVSPLSWYNLWSKKGYSSWESWFEGREFGDTLESNGRMTITAREVIGIKEMANYNISRNGPHLIIAKPPQNKSNISLVNYHDKMLSYEGDSSTVYNFLKNNLFKKLDRNLTFHASPHLIIAGNLITVQQYLDEHKGIKNYTELHQDLLTYDPQGPLLEQASPNGYTMDDLNKGLMEVFARNPNAAYLLDLRGANLSGVNPFKNSDSKKAYGNECYLNGLLADLSGSIFIDRDKINILFAEGIYNGADFSNAKFSGVKGQIWDSNYDDTTKWHDSSFPDSNERLIKGYNPNAEALKIYNIK